MTLASVTGRFLRNSATMVLLYIGSNGLGFVVGVMLARLLGAAQYGNYALAMTSATLAGLVTEFGLPVLAMRETGRARGSGDWSLLKGLLRWADLMVLALSGVIAAGFVGWYILAGARQGSAFLQLLLWGVTLIPIVALGKIRSFVLLALDEVWAGQAPVLILRPLLFIGLCLSVWGVRGRLNPATAMAVQVLGAGVATVVMMVLYRRFRPQALVDAAPKFKPRDWLSACLPMGLTEGLRLLQGQLALLLVGALAGAAAAGTYRVGDAVASLTMVVTSVVGTAATPLFARLHVDGDHAGLERIALLSAWAMLGGALIIGLPVLVMGHWLFPMLFGHDFSAAAPIFALLWGGILLAAGGGLAMALANMAGQHMLSTQSFALIALVNLLLGLLLIPTLGARGGAVASAVALVIGTVLCAWRLHRRTGINATIFTRRSLHLLCGLRWPRGAGRG